MVVDLSEDFREDLEKEQLKMEVLDVGGDRKEGLEIERK